MLLSVVCRFVYCSSVLLDNHTYIACVRQAMSYANSARATRILLHVPVVPSLQIRTYMYRIAGKFGEQNLAKCRKTGEI